MFRKLFTLILFAGLVFWLLVAPLRAQDWNGRSSEKLEREIFAMLRDKDVGEVAEQMARAPAPREIWPLVVRLNIFLQAGHDARAQETLRQLLQIQNIAAPENWVAAQIIRECLPPDLALQRLYYERILPNDADALRKFYELWRDSGNTKGLEEWLEKCGGKCLGVKIDWSVRRGAVDELLDGLEAAVTAKPNDLELLESCLGALVGAEYLANHLNKPLKTGFRARLPRLLKSFSPSGPTDYYALGEVVTVHNPQLAVEFWQKALSLPFTPQDEQLFAQRYTRYMSISPNISNWPKVFHYQIMKRLVEGYQQLGRADAAQPLVQELVTLSQDKEIGTMESYRLAGQVQAASGFRVVESKILQDEAAQRNSVAYWLERVNYYEGRDEPEQARQALRQALVNLPYRANDKPANQARLGILSAFERFVEKDCDEQRNDNCDNYNEDGRAICLQQKSNCSEVISLLRQEIVSHQTDLVYVLGVLDILDADLEDVRDNLFAEFPTLFSRYFASPEAGDWGGEWGNRLVENIVESERLTLAFKEKFVSQLERLALAQPSQRPLALAKSIKEVFPQKTFALLKSCQAMGEVCLGKEWERGNLIDTIFSAYLAAQEWKAAEELILAEKSILPRVFYHYLGQLTVRAVHRNDLNEAMRLWRLLNRYDRRNVGSLKNWATPPMKLKLREFYLEMKKNDPNSSIPDAALALL